MTTNLVLSPPVLDASGGNSGVIVKKRGPKPRCTPELKKRIVELLYTHSLQQIVDMPDMPSRYKVDKAAEEDPVFETSIVKARACHVQFLLDKSTAEMLNCDEKNWKSSQARANFFCWLAERLMPRRYGNKTQLSNAEGDGPIELIVKHIVVQGK
jgi:hypothetical protein